MSLHGKFNPVCVLTSGLYIQHIPFGIVIAGEPGSFSNNHFRIVGVAADAGEKLLVTKPRIDVTSLSTFRSTCEATSFSASSLN